MSTSVKLSKNPQTKPGLGKLFKDQKGIAPILILVLLLAGIGAGSYLVTQKTNLFPQAAKKSTNKACAVTLKGNIEIDTECSKGKTSKVKFLCSNSAEYKYLGDGSKKSGSCKSLSYWKSKAQAECKKLTASYCKNVRGEAPGAQGEEETKDGTEDPGSESGNPNNNEQNAP